VSFYSLAQADVVVDLEGYTSAAAANGSGAGLYQALASPVRICDTRPGNPSALSPPNAQCNGAGNVGETLPAKGTLDVQVTGNNGIPLGAAAAVFNVTVANPTGSGYLTVYPQGVTQPVVSNVNYSTDQVTANRVIVPLSATGEISVYSQWSADVIIDVSGYFTAAGGSGTQFTPEPAPVRICDTRDSNPSDLSAGDAQCNGNILGSNQSMTVNVTGLAGVPANAKAVVINLTGVAPTAPMTYLTVFPGPTRPTASDLNLVQDQIKANLVVATLSANGKISIYNQSGNVNVVIDVLGWYS
jgi:hypothetical protein